MEIKQEPFNSTLMSSIKAAYKYYYQEDILDSLLYGLSGIAFTIAISKGIGPCAPYTFNMEGLQQLCVENLGLSIMNHEYPINPKNTTEERKKASDQIKAFLDEGHLVLVNSYEFQLITGYNETHFITTKPWDAPSVTPDIELDTLHGIKDFLLYSKIEKVEGIDRIQGIKNSIGYALKQYDDIKTMDFVTQGINAYNYMLEQISEENYNGHGIWWSCNVWAECRRKAKDFMMDITQVYDNLPILEELAFLYEVSCNYFLKLSNKEEGSLENKKKWITLLEENDYVIKGLLEELK